MRLATNPPVPTERPPLRVDEVISLLGGERRLAVACGLQPDAVRKWRRRGFPPHLAMTIWRFAQESGVHQIGLESIHLATPLQAKPAAARGRGRPRHG